MGTRIEAVASVGSALPIGARKLADRAARRCLRLAKRDPHEVDLLINAGVYREHNLAEPALAALIQEDIRANPEERIGAAHGTFSFDVSDGGCGVLSAIELVDGFLQSGSIDLGLVVASDADPGHSEGFPFGRAGAAALLSWSDADVGFVELRFQIFSEHAGLYDSHIDWHEEAGRRHHGQNLLTVKIDPSFAARCLDCAEEAVAGYLDHLGLSRADVDFVVPSQFPPTFPDGLAQRLGLPIERVARVGTELSLAHTAGPLAAWNAATKAESFGRARNVLFVTVGAGVSVGVALYQR